jgi:hypothetical protein
VFFVYECYACILPCDALHEDIRHYQRIAAALAETIALMELVDEVIEEYGGWLIG